MVSLAGTEVLLLEDAQDVLWQMRMALEGDGVNVHDGRTAKSGVLLASQVFPHVIVIDLGLVGEGGFHALQLLKLVPGMSKVPVLALTHAGDREGVILAVSMGVSEVLLKPFSSATFLERIEKLVALKPFGNHVIKAPEVNGATLTLPVEIRRVGEDGFSVEVSAILGREVEVGLNSPLLRRLGCADAIIRGSGTPAWPTEEGTFVNDLDLVGTPPGVARAIRTFLEGA